MNKDCQVLKKYDKNKDNEFSFEEFKQCHKDLPLLFMPAFSLMNKLQVEVSASSRRVLQVLDSDLLSVLWTRLLAKGCNSPEKGQKGTGQHRTSI